ncbi:MAG TPA: heavy metal translocating P-type ATPase [Pirellulales bacterium]
MNRSTPPPYASAAQAGLCLVALIAGWIVDRPEISFYLYLLAYIAGGAAALLEAIKAAARRQLTVDLLMVLAAAGAAVLGDWAEGGVLLFLFSLSNALEDFATYRTKHTVQSLVQLRPSEALLLRDGQELTVGIQTLAPGDLVRVRPGEHIPLDGEVVDGETWVNEATITGESEPVVKASGATVFAGTINGHGSVVVRATKLAADSMLERIVKMVHEAQSQKNPTQQFVESWQQAYVSGVLLAAAIVFAGALFIHTSDVRHAFYHAMVLLVVASPCAVVIGSPAVVLSAIARAAQLGVLFKGGRYLELLGNVDTVAFDKTGTITLGAPGVDALWVEEDASPDAMLRLAAAVERRSEHHVADAIVAEAQRRRIELPESTEFDYHVGLGVHAHVEGSWIGVGHERMFAGHGIAIPQTALDAARHLREQGQTALIVAAPEAGIFGVIGLSDQIRPDAAAALAALKRMGIQANVILTGDNEQVAQRVAQAIGADAAFAGLLPEQKVAELRRLAKAGRTVAMVGDGVNDAPALAVAGVGIAMGGAGTDVALEVADVVLMRDDLTALPMAIWISRQAKRRIRQNMLFALGVIGVLVLLSFMNLPLWLGVLCHEGSTVLVVLNGLRVLIERPAK